MIKTSTKYYVGIDAGGTKTEFVLTDESGLVLSQTVKGSANPNDITIDKAYRVLSDGLKELLQGREIDSRNLYIFAGVAGTGVGENASLLRDMLLQGYKNVSVSTDLVNALEIALGDEDGLVVICGTGLSCCICANGSFRIIGGYGYLFEDGGSGYAYGRDAINAALKAEDGIGEKTVLLEYLQAYFGRSVRASLGELLKKGKSFVASFCPMVFKGNTAEDEVCKKIIENNLACTVELIQKALSISEKGMRKIAFIGGVSKERLFQERMRKEFDGHELLFCKEKPVFGAVRRAYKGEEKC